MGVQHFFKQRRPRQFSHKPIYWDVRKEELNDRVERIRQEMIASGEYIPKEGEHIPPAPNTSEGSSEFGDLRGYDTRKAIAGKFRKSTEHLQRQYEKGIDADERYRRSIRLMLILMGIFFAVWYFFFR